MKTGLREYPPGTVVGGRYEVIRVIGRGGMSTVYLVRDSKLDGAVWALKTAGKKGEGDGRLCRQGLAAEISLLRRLRHPGLPRIADVIEEDDRISVVMDYIEGETLLEIVRRRGPVRQESAAAWGIALAGVLGCLHSQDPPVIYRDMKPGNVMLCPDGRVVLFDFGIAREYKEEGTADTVCLGTVGYAAPEQFGGSGQTDARTDVYGLGATLYYLVTGRDPSRPPCEMVPIRRVDPSLSSGLERIILKCTRSDPAERYQSCEALAAALASYRDLDDRCLRRAARRLALFGASAASCAVLLWAGCAFAAEAGRERRSDYARALLAAGDLAAESLHRGAFNQEVVDRYTAALDLFPDREEAGIGLLDYCSDIGETAAGLSVVCARIDAGRVVPARCGNLIYRAASLYFSGNEGDGDFGRDYRKAAVYFSMLDGKEYPEAEEYAALASALGVFGREVDWEKVAASLGSFSERCGRRALNEGRIRDMLLCAELYAANRHEFEYIGVDAEQASADLLRRAAEDAARLVSEGQHLEKLRVRALLDLAGILQTDPATAREAAELYGTVLDLTGEEDRKKEIRYKELNAMMTAGDEIMVKELYELLITDYPDDADAFLWYCSWLLEKGCSEEAASVFRLGEKRCGTFAQGANYAALKERMGL